MYILSRMIATVCGVIYLTEKARRKSIPCPWMSLPFENALQRERERQRRQREGGQHTDLSARMDTPTLSPAGVGSPLGTTSLHGSQQHDGHGDRIEPTGRSIPIGSRG